VIVDRFTGQVRPAQIFVAVMGASNFTYAEASWTQALADWIDTHTRAFAALGGVPKQLVPDNTKVAVIKACLYEPQVNRTYAELAAHYDTAILPARPRRPRDKAKVEVAVLIIERWLLCRLRHRRFYSLAELNAAISELLGQLNDERPIRRLGVTRRALFEELNRPNLKSLPADPYCFAEWRIRRVGVDYHVGLSGMAQAFAELEASDETDALTHADWLGLLHDRELTHRRDKRLAARLRYARLRQQASVEDVDYRAPRSLDRALFHKLTNSEWIDAHDNLILCGPTGVGKSWLACALGHKACRDNRSVLYQRVPKLFAELALARGDGRYARILRGLTGVQLLILDDWGLEPLAGC
jgi:hypothetical protein